MMTTTPLRLKLEFVVQRGAVTSLLGTELGAGGQCALHVDHRSWAEISQELRTAGASEPTVFMAQGLELALSFDVAAEERAA